MSGWCFFRGLKFAALAAIVVGAVGFGVMALWNQILPDLFGWHAISYWQAVGLLVLSRILFGGFRGGMHCRRHRLDRWEHMSPEEQERFRTGMRGFC